MSSIPSSVYHLQVNKAFPLKRVSQLIPYLNDLGIEGIYCSPLYDSFDHTYAVTNPNRLNPDLGTPVDFEDFCRLLKRFGLKLVLDVVPNHMGIKGDKNLWWLDVLEKGPTSPYAPFFDINWRTEKEEMADKVLLPILNRPYGHVLERGELRLIWKEGFFIHYFDYLLPICHASYPQILRRGAFRGMGKDELCRLYQKSQSLKRHIQGLLTAFNRDSNLLHELLEKQFYRLSFWVVAGQEINYRRFFNINDLVAIHIEKEKVLEAHHRWIFELIARNHVQGLRIDHPDGLYDPTQYFERIRQKKPGFIWVEKILRRGEDLPAKWNVDGTVGYDFLNVLSGLFIQKENEQLLTEIYHQFVQGEVVFEAVHYERRKRYILLHMASEINFLGGFLDELSEKNRYFRDFTRADLTRACLEIIACFPVYRTYIRPGVQMRKTDRDYVITAVEQGKTKAPEVDGSVFNYIRGVLLLEHEFSLLEKELSIDFLLRFQQLTAPVMAKGLEDSTCFIYNRLISLNEVGNSPYDFGCTKEGFHTFNRKKLSSWPLGALTSSTQDSKYSEDARLRLHVLSELPSTWRSLVFALKKRHARFLTPFEGKLWPEPNTQYFLYQMMLILGPDDPERLWRCLNKAIREAGTHTSWRCINAPYESAVRKFLNAVLKNPGKKFLSLHKKIADLGHLNSLSALVLKLGSCGIVDIYQGDELYNLSLVDPDNRRAVNFAKRKKELSRMKDLKIRITAEGLRLRRAHKDLFLKGAYLPLKTPDHVIAFARVWEKQEVIFLACRFFSGVHKNGHVTLPKRMRQKMFRNLLTGKEVTVRHGRLLLSEVFTPWTFAILVSP